MHQYSRRILGLKLQGKYEIKREIGKGGRGIVFEAYDHGLNRNVAIKVIAHDTASSDEQTAFQREAQILADLSEHVGHHVLPVYSLETDFIDDIPTLYLVMRLASKGTLADLLKNRKPLPIDFVKRIVEQTGEALRFAHSRSIIHLDFKPANVLFDNDDNAWVADFGLAKLLESTSTKGETGVGTQNYMAPEQKEGLEVGVFSDVYAFGITLYQMLTGQLPKKEMVSNTTRLLLSTELPVKMRGIIERATAYNPRQRYLSFNELLLDISSTFPAEKTTQGQIPAIQQSLMLVDVPSPGLPPFPLNSSENTGDLLEAMRDLGKFCEENPDINEREVVTYSCMKLLPALGYVKPSEDILLEFRQTDVILQGFDKRYVAVIEFKRPNRSPEEGYAQLNDRYIPALEPNVGVLCNGRKLWVYNRIGKSLVHPPYQINLKDATLEDAKRVNYWLGKRDLDLSNINDLDEAIKSIAAAAMPVRGANEPGGQEFLKQFTLRRETPFSDLVLAMFNALPTMLEISNFTRGAYTFWRRIYAPREQKKDTIPSTWKSLLSRSSSTHSSTNDSDGSRSREEIYYLMFAIESSYAVLSRLLLGRAMENHEFPDLDLRDAFLSGLKHLREGRNKLPPVAFGDGMRNLFSYLGKMAFQSLFGSDIFDWWYDIRGCDDPDTAELGLQLAKCTLAIFRFDFKPMNGDLLGELYQAYFDADTRKALGEFYTPPEIVDFMLDELGYTVDNPNLANMRLLDPSCGSGTFIVHALRRYLASLQGKPANEVLQKLLGGLKIVGFDLNPFAVLMAQANYAAQIIPLCAQLDDFSNMRSIPILRTDSLRQEYREGEQVEILPGQTVQYTLGFSVTQDDNVTIIQTELPIIEDEEEHFLSTKIPVPRYDKAYQQGWIGNPEEYFVLLRVLFDSVMKGGSNEKVLTNRLINAGLQHAQELAHYMLPATQQLIEDVRHLKEEYDDDGRFLKTLSDLALAIVLKNDVFYDYVVGNPPYIRIQAIPESLRTWWDKWYTWANQNFDAFIPFMERGIHLELPAQATSPQLHGWLNVGGKLGFICPGRFLQSNYAKELRAQLPKRAAIELLLDLRDSAVFKDATNYPAIIIVRKLENGESSSSKTFPALRVFDGRGQNAASLLEEARTLKDQLLLGQSYTKGQYMDSFVLKHSDLGNASWNLMPPQEKDVFQKLENAATIHRIDDCPLCKDTPPAKIERERQRDHDHTITLEDITTTSSGGFQGVATGHDPSLVFFCLQDRGDTLLVRPKGALDPDWQGPTEVEIEKAVLRPWLFGRDVQRWNIHWGNWYVFFPYDRITAMEKRGKHKVSVTRLRLIPTSDARDIFIKKDEYVEDFPLLDKKYPKFWRDYLTHPAIEKNLRSRERGLYKKSSPNGYKWYELSRGQNLECFDQQKLVIQMNANYPKCAIEEDDKRFVFQAGGRGGGVYGMLPDLHFMSTTLLTGLLNSPALDFYLKHISTVFGGNYYSYSDSFIKEIPIKFPITEIDQAKARSIESSTKNSIRASTDLCSKEEARDTFPQQQYKLLSPRHSLYPLGEFVLHRPQAQKFKRDKEPVKPQINMLNELEVKCGRNSLTLKHVFLADIITTWLRLQPNDEINMADLLALRVPSAEEGCRILVNALLILEGEIDQIKDLLGVYEQELASLVADYYGLDERDVEVANDFLQIF